MGFERLLGFPDLVWTSRSGVSWDHSESESSHSSRTRRRLPQVPPERLDALAGSRLGQERLPGPESQDRLCPRPADWSQRLGLQDELDPDSLSDASRSDDGAFLDKGQRPPGQLGSGSTSGSTSFYIGSEDSPARLHKLKLLGPSERTPEPPTTVLIRNLSGPETRRGGVKQNSSAPNLQSQDRDVVSSKDQASSSSMVRQESFTRDGSGDGSGDGVQVKKLPHISSQPSMRDMEPGSLQDSQVLLQGPAGASLDAPLAPPMPLAPPTPLRGPRKASTRVEDSLSGESDVDTASTVSQVSSKNTPLGPAPKARPALSGLQKEKSSSSPSIQDKGRHVSARQRLSEKRRHQVGVEAGRGAEPARASQVRRSQGPCGSLDLSAGPGWSESASSDYETSCQPARSRKLLAPPPRDEGGKPSRVPQQPLTRSNSLSAPRPTRASMLRRARLGEASDTEGGETERVSEPSSVPAGRKLSRLDILALPRKRSGSFTTPSDTETSSSGRSHPSNPSNRTSEPPPANRKWSAAQAAHKGKQLPTRNRNPGAKASSAGESGPAQDLSFDLSEPSPVGGRDSLQEVLKTLSWFVCRSPAESQGLRRVLVL